MLGQRQVTPKFADDPVQRHISSGRVGVGGVCPPRKDIRKWEERDGRFK